ncbi:hypothetical protein AN964_23945 [Heyndrickxia shackletonii]|uniref:Uncharacterized protein n=1 Tax=Heyndrickxia shackletonii TaxID=157838 RepID=A0A0Q3WQU4_9BACI|nr:hypothetical protein AN964_23945 [Heyndrickxia shackletonii]
MILCCKIQAQGADLGHLVAEVLGAVLVVGHLVVLRGVIRADPVAVLLVGLLDGHVAVLRDVELPGAALPGVALPGAGLPSIEQQTECGKMEICGHLL